MATRHGFPTDTSIELFRKSIFRVQCSYEDTATQAIKTIRGTAFVVGVYQTNRNLILATARHLLDVPRDVETKWIFLQADDIGNITRRTQFAVKANATNPPYHKHKNCDVGVFALPSQGIDVEKLAFVDERPLPMIALNTGIATGTTVAWAGFSAEVEDLFHFPCLCYYEGAVSLFVDRQDARYYIIDGHNAFGVSGGPVWYWAEERQRYEVAAVISAYKHGEQGMPGVVIAEPINHIAGYLQTEIWQPGVTKDVIILDGGQ